MFSYCFRILTPLLILWQLILPVSAPWLHSCEDVCCASACEQSHSSVRLQHCAEAVRVQHSCPCRFHLVDQNSSHSSDEQAPSKKPHDCSSCAVCQALTAPRTLVAMVEMASTEQAVSSILVADCADPLLGFGLPPQCRAPPRS